jgi:four helix bundle protein
MKHENLKQRTKQLAIRIFKMVAEFPPTGDSRIIGNQIVRSATSLAANYRAGCLAKSKRDFINKLKIVEEESDETIFWLELIEELQYFPPEKNSLLRAEANEIFLIVVASIKTARKNSQKDQSDKPSPITSH